MCLHAAQVFDRHTGREYGFGKCRLSNPPHTTELNLMMKCRDYRPITWNLKGTLPDLVSKQQWQILETNGSKQKG